MVAVDADFWIPALALALDQREPKTSPDGLEAVGLAAVEEVDAVDAKEVVDGMPGLALAGLERDWEGLLTATDVK